MITDRAKNCNKNCNKNWENRGEQTEGMVLKRAKSWLKEETTLCLKLINQKVAIRTYYLGKRFLNVRRNS